MRKLIDAWVDAELDGASSRRVESHVRECGYCSSTADMARLLKHSLRRARDREPARLAAARLRRFAGELAGT